MKHPRDLYVRACSEVGKFNGFDYFTYGSFTGTKEINTRYRGLTRLLENPVNAPERIKKCYLYFKDAETRIYLEGLLLSYDIDKIVELKGFTEQFLEDYMSYFFDIDYIKENKLEHLFIKTITESEIESWFMKCSTLNWSSMYYLITGNSKLHPALENMQNIRADMYNLYKATMPVDKIINSKSKLTARDKYNIDIAIKFANTAAKYAFNEIRLAEEINKSTDNLKEDWRLICKKSPTNIYDLPLTPDSLVIMAELEEQFGQFPGLKVPETDQINELMKVNNAGD